MLMEHTLFKPWGASLDYQDICVMRLFTRLYVIDLLGVFLTSSYFLRYKSHCGLLVCCILNQKIIRSYQIKLQARNHQTRRLAVPLVCLLDELRPVSQHNNPGIRPNLALCSSTKAGLVNGIFVSSRLYVFDLLGVFLMSSYFFRYASHCGLLVYCICRYDITFWYVGLLVF